MPIDSAHEIEELDNNYEEVMKSCLAHCSGQSEVKAFYGLKQTRLFTYECICFSSLPGGDVGMLSKFELFVCILPKLSNFQVTLCMTHP